MNIAISIRRLNIRGGAQRMVAHAAKQWRAQGHRVTIYTLYYDKEACYPEILKDFRVVVADDEVTARMRATGMLQGPVGYLRNFINESRAARNLALKMEKDTDVLHPHDQLVYRSVRYFKKEVRNVPAVWMLDDMPTKKHSLLRNSQFDQTIKTSLLKHWWYWFVDILDYWFFLRYLDSIAVVDTRDKEWAEEAFNKPTKIVRNGLDIAEFPFMSRTGIQEKKIHLLAVALLLPHRRFEDCIESVRVLLERGFEPTLSIIGAPLDPTYERKLHALVHERGLETYVHFLGKVSHDDLLAAFRAADIFVFVAHLQSWGLAVFEAMSMGLPVIVSETTGASEVLEDRNTAMIVPPYSPEKIADAAVALVDSALYQRISKDARTFVEQEISWERYAQELLYMFEEARRHYA
ncbi:MAG: glycosyltransferase family 4 protein [bacterium]|nr:glycosyltransferase family 4 protein [bacterium]